MHVASGGKENLYRHTTNSFPAIHSGLLLIQDEAALLSMQAIIVLPTGCAMRSSRALTNGSTTIAAGFGGYTLSNKHPGPQLHRGGPLPILKPIS